MLAQGHRKTLSVLLRFLISTIIFLIATLLIYDNVSLNHALTRGIETGNKVKVQPIASPSLGTDLNLPTEANTAEIKTAIARVADAGLTGFCQIFAWDTLEPQQGVYDWAFSDTVVQAASENGLQVIAILNRSPQWARSDWNSDNVYAPPADMNDYAAFCAAFAERYAGDIAGYQIWDQPNIYPNWGNGTVEPNEYVEMLATASPAIREAAPGAVIIGGGLAPNTESGGTNLSDITYLQEIYRRGAGDYIDVLGVKAYGFWSGPYDRTTDEQTLNFSRLVLLREEMVSRGDADKPIWILGGGWVAQEDDYVGEPSPIGADSYLIQSQRLEQAIERIREEWPWVGYACLQTAQHYGSADDPLQGLALFSSNGSRTLLGNALVAAVRPQQTLYPGLTLPSDIYLDENLTGEMAEATLYGSGIWLQMDSSYTGGLSVLVDERHTATEINPPTRDDGWVRVTSGMSLRKHTLVFYGDTEARSAILAIRVSNSYVNIRETITLALGVVIAIWQAVLAVFAAKELPWKRVWQKLLALWQKLPESLQWGLQIILAIAILALSNSWLALLAVICYGITALFSPWKATCLAAAAIPFAPLGSGLMVGQFGITEITVLVALAAWSWNALLGSIQITWKGFHQFKTMDWLVFVLVAIAAISVILAEYQHVALREFRVTIAESAILYALIRLQRHKTTKSLLLIDILWGVGTLVALYALAIYPTSGGVIEAEGVRRARAFYGSPNNLALVMERLWPLGLAMALWGKTKWRRWAYGLSSGLMLIVLLLTFSRGAIFFALPAAALVLALSLNKRWRTILLIGLIVLIIAAIPIIGTERLTTMLDPQGGTTGLRVSLWQASLKMLKDHPILGIGPDNFLYYYGDYILESAMIDPNLSHPHNLLLDFWLRLGILGPVLLIAILVTFVRTVRKKLPGTHGDRYAVIIGLSSGLAAAVMHGLGDSFFFVTELALWTMLLLAWVTNENENKGEQQEL